VNKGVHQIVSNQAVITQPLTVLCGERL